MSIHKNIIDKCKSQVFDYAKHPYMITTLEGVILECNDAALEQLESTSKEETLGCSLVDFFPEHQEDGSESTVKISRIIKESIEKGFSNFEWQYKDKHDEIVWGEIALTYANIDNEALLYFSWHDIHEKKVLQHHYEVSKESKAQFLTNISHEIKTPMNAIMGFCEQLQKSDLEKKDAEYLEAIMSNSQNLLYLLNDILDSSKMRLGHMSLHYEVVSIATFCEDLNHVFTQRAEEQELNFTSNIESNVPEYVLLDVQRVISIVNSLLDNAFKFTKKGFVNFEVASSHVTAKECTLIFRVSDSGIGILKEKLKYIFELFTQEDASDTREFGGVGLGLSMSYELAKMMNGNLRVTSQKDKGSIFTFEVSNVQIASKEDYVELTDESNTVIAKEREAHECVTLSEHGKDKLSDFLVVVEKELLAEYANVMLQQNIDSYETWANRLLTEAQKYENCIMSKYADELIACINRFDMENLTQLLKNFESMIEELKSIDSKTRKGEANE